MTTDVVVTNVERTPHLIIAVLTYRRPDDLAELLPLLAAQIDDVAQRQPDAPSMEVLVVDNDPAAGARDVVAKAGSDAVRYVCEPAPGIANGRNRALTEASGADLLVFIDDDERPQTSWLFHLLRARQAYGAAAVAGPVVSEFDGVLDPWIVAGRYFERLRHRTGTRLTMAATNNLLLDLRTLEPWDLRFDLEFATSGGEDTLFTRTIVERGGIMVWCDEAVVTDRVPRARMNRRWVLLRAFSSGNGSSRVGLALATSFRSRLRVRTTSSIDGLVRVTGGLASWCFGAATHSLSRRARGLRTASRGAGMLSGVVGYRYVEYGRPESSVSSAPP